MHQTAICFMNTSLRLNISDFTYTHRPGPLDAMCHNNKMIYAEFHEFFICAYRENVYKIAIGTSEKLFKITFIVSLAAKLETCERQTK